MANIYDADQATMPGTLTPELKLGPEFTIWLHQLRHAVRAMKLSTLTIALGKPSELSPVSVIDPEGYTADVFTRDEAGRLSIYTKESPNGIVVPSDATVVIRIIGGHPWMKSKIDDRYHLDIYFWTPEKAKQMTGKEVKLHLDSEVMDTMLPILDASSAPKYYETPEESREVVIISESDVAAFRNNFSGVLTEEQLDYLSKHSDALFVHNEWDPEDVLTPAFIGDAYVLDPKDTTKGYRIGKEEFNQTHRIDA